jgi:hypothetical protein
MELNRIRKYNSGAGAVLCNQCSTIVKEGFIGNAYAEAVHKKRGTFPDGMISEADWASDEPMFCDSCKKKNEDTDSKSTEEQ